MPSLAPKASASRAPIGVGTLCVAGILIGAAVTPLVVYGIAGMFQIGACPPSGDPFACTMRHFSMIGVSVLPGALLGFAISYKYCTWRENKARG